MRHAAIAAQIKLIREQEAILRRQREDLERELANANAYRSYYTGYEEYNTREIEEFLSRG